MKTCKQCGRQLPEEAYYKNTYVTKDGRRHPTTSRKICKRCCNSKRLERKRAQWDTVDRIDRAMSTPEGFDNLLKEYGL